jgi:mono/diheme cytochrome c family protein
MRPAQPRAIVAIMEKRRLAAASVTAMLIVQPFGPMAPESLAMPADDQRPDNLESVRIGRMTAREHCARCHAIGRRGASPNRKAPPFRLIAERYPGANPAPDLAEGIVTRHPGMPEFRLTLEETDGLIAYLRNVSRLYRRGATP